MTQVIDASAIVAALVDGGRVGIWCARQLVVDEMAAPQLLPFEVANVVRRMEARGVLERSSAAMAIEHLRQLDVVYVPFEALADRAWLLRANLSVYDAAYVALAELVDGRLVTLDERLARAPGISCPVTVAPDR